MATKLSLTKDSPLDTTLVDGNNAAKYEIETTVGHFGKTTVIRRLSTTSDEQGQSAPRTPTEIGRIEWKCLFPDTITYHNHERKGEDLLAEGSDSTYLMSGGGNPLRWSKGHSGVYLERLGNWTTFSKMDTSLVAKLHKESEGEVILEVGHEGLAMLDLIVVSMVYVESKRREKAPPDGGDGGGSGGC